MKRSSFRAPVAALATAALTLTALTFVSIAPASAVVQTVPVYQADIRPNENTYPGWHEGYVNATPAYSVDAAGLHIGVGAHSQILNGLSAPRAVSTGELLPLIETMNVAEDATSTGSTTLQVAVNWAAGGWSTLRSEQDNTFITVQATDLWESSKPIGAIAANTPTALSDIVSALEALGSVTVGGFGIQADSTATAIVDSVSWDGTDYVFTAAPTVAACGSIAAGPGATDLNAQGWDFSETRTTGHNDFVPTGLHVYTEAATSTDKAAGYHALSIPLASVGEPQIAITDPSGGQPSIQLGIDLTGDGTWDGYLVNEGDLYGHGMWWTNKTTFGVAPGGGYPSLGTLDQYLAANPRAKVVNFGYSLGSGVFGSAIINSITVGCTSYGFSKVPPTTITACTGPHTQAAVTTNATASTQGWNFSQSRKRGYNALVPGGLSVTTTADDTGLPQDQSKAAGYLPVSIPLKDAGTIGMVLTNATGAEPGLQLGVDLNNDGIEDGLLVSESIYGDNLWASNAIVNHVPAFVGLPTVGGGGGTINGTLNDYLAAYPDAKIMHIGYSMGSGAIGSADITKITVGCTDYTFNESNFTDVPSGALFYTEIQSAALVGITTGYNDGGGLRSYHPTEAITRQAMAAFLYRAAGSPAFVAPTTASFPDVPVGASFFKEIEWMKSVNITTGYGDGTFNPTGSVTRQAMAAFLYRAAH